MNSIIVKIPFSLNTQFVFLINYIVFFGLFLTEKALSRTSPVSTTNVEWSLAEIRGKAQLIFSMNVTEL